MQRVGLDYDFRDVVFLRSILFKIRNEYSPSYFRAYISPSGRGYHIWFSVDDDYTYNDLLRIRHELYDDPNRISVIDGNIYRDVLFDIKVVDGVVMKTKEIDVDSVIEFGKEVLVGLNG